MPTAKPTATAALIDPDAEEVLRDITGNKNTLVIFQLAFTTKAEAHEQLSALLNLCHRCAGDDKPVFVILETPAAIESCPWPMGDSVGVTRFAEGDGFMSAMKSAQGHRLYVW